MKDSRCQTKIGSSCKIETLLNSNGTQEVVDPCVPHAVCYKGECTCKDGYSRTNQGTCALSFGQACNHTGYFECNLDHGLSCVNEKCACTDYHFTFDPETQECVDSLMLPLKSQDQEEPIAIMKQHENSRPELDPKGGGGGLMAPLLITVTLLLFLAVGAVLFRNPILNFIRKA
jgi:hypothetical protein